jgi:hypothetical protein
MSFKLVEHPGGDPRVPWTMRDAGTVSAIFSEDSPLVYPFCTTTSPINPVARWLDEHAQDRYRLCPVKTSASVPAIVFQDYATAVAFKLRWHGAVVTDDEWT